MADLLIIFVKAPRAGFVKARLAKTMGASAACTAYRTLVETLLRNLKSLKTVELHFTPPDGEADISVWLRPGWHAKPQSPGDLGARLKSAFQAAFSTGPLSTGPNKVVIIGSDCPDVTETDIHDAWKELAAHDVVIGPASDGGYWLIGLRSPQPALFEEIKWSSETVLGETLEQAKQMKLRVQLLRILTDVDDQSAWDQFLRGRPNISAI